MESLRHLCQFLSNLDLQEADPSLIAHARLILIDTLGVMVAGGTEGELSSLLQALSFGDNKQSLASCLGRHEQVNPLIAALINGIAGSRLEFEEGNSWAFGHPAIQIVPALVAQAEGQRTSGKELLEALVAGYECGVRVSRASKVRKGLHPSGTWGTVGAAAAVAKLRARSPSALYEILNLSASFTISPYVKNAFVGKNVAYTFAGMASFLGFLSNVFFDAGFRADESSLRMTFSKFVSDVFKEEELDRELGKEFFLLKNYFKPYPSCRFTHPALDALKAILRNVSFRRREVERIRVETFQAAAHCDTKAPPNLEAVRFSLPYLIAGMLSFGDITLDTIQRISVQDDQLRKLAARVEVRSIPEYEALRPVRNPARVTLQLKNGQTHVCEVKNPSGEEGCPLSQETIQEKFLSLTVPILGKDRSEAFWEKAIQLEKENDIRPLIALLRLPRDVSYGKGST